MYSKYINCSKLTCGTNLRYSKQIRFLEKTAIATLICMSFFDSGITVHRQLTLNTIKVTILNIALLTFPTGEEIYRFKSTKLPCIGICIQHYVHVNCGF